MQREEREREREGHYKEHYLVEGEQKQQAQKGLISLIE